MTQAQPQRGGSGLKFTISFFVGLLLIFVGERVLFDAGTTRYVLGGLGDLAIAIAIIGRVIRGIKLPSQARRVEWRILICYLLGVLALLVYAAQADFFIDHVRPLFADAKGVDRYIVIMSVLWPIILLCALMPLILIESAYAAMDTSSTVEFARIRRSGNSGLVIAMTISFVFLFNYVANKTTTKVDLSYFKTTKPSVVTLKMVNNLNKPFRIVLFFPSANEVLDHLQGYMQEVARASSQVSVEVVDHLLKPTLAKELGATANGTIVFVYEGKKEKFQMNTKLKYAKNRLRKLDKEFQSSFLKAVKSRRVAYMTQGHEERAATNRGDPPKPGTGVTFMRRQLSYTNYSIKDLGQTDLAWQVPADATVVIVNSPLKEFLPSEIESLKKYVQRGGRLMVYLDAEADVRLDGLLSALGLQFTAETLASAENFARLTYTPADRENIFTNRYSSHPSMTTLSQNSRKVATVLMRSGYLTKVPPTDAALQVNPQFVLHSLPSVWNDKNRNWQFDAADEKRQAYELAAIVTVKQNKDAAPKTDPKKGSSDPEGRVLVVADSDIAADKLFSNAGNAYFFVDSLKWLVGDEDEIGELSSEEDIKIRHTREEDQWWFYLTIFLMPAIILAGGLLYTRIRRRRRSTQ